MKCALRATGHIRISVSDTGAGLPPEKLAQLFQSFNRLGQQGSAEEGTGIGLVVTKRLVEVMGGTIGVESTEGVGSTFWVDLISDVEPRISLPGDAPPTILASQAPDPQVRTLLYVEDNPANLQLVVQIIARRPNMRLLSAKNGHLGIELARTSRPDVILMDINLPGMSGIKAMQILRADTMTAHIPVVALSANAMPRDIERGLQAGFFRYLTKPLKVDEFLETLDVALEFAAREVGQNG
jgi:CheY-like chemotaxis protein